MEESETGGRTICTKHARSSFSLTMLTKACRAENKELVIKMLYRSSGIRNREAVSGVSHSTVLKWLKATAATVVLRPKKYGYQQVQIDEQWSWVARKNKKVWMLYAYAVQEDEMIAFTMGKCSAATVRNLWMKLKAIALKC